MANERNLSWADFAAQTRSLALTYPPNKFMICSVMCAEATTPSQPILDLAKSLAERQMACLERLAAIGMELAELALERARAAPAEEDLSGAMKDHARVARAVRLTHMLQTKILTDLDRQVREAAHRVEQAEAQDQRQAEEQRKAQIERSVERLARVQHAGDADEVDRLIADCGERLDYEDHGWLLARPAGEVLADICQALDLTLDWETLQDLAWVKDESPFPLDGGKAGIGGDGSAAVTPEGENRLAAETLTGHPHPRSEDRFQRSTSLPHRGGRELSG